MGGEEEKKGALEWMGRGRGNSEGDGGNRRGCPRLKVQQGFRGFRGSEAQAPGAWSRLPSPRMGIPGLLDRRNHILESCANVPLPLCTELAQLPAPSPSPRR